MACLLAAERWPRGVEYSSDISLLNCFIMPAQLFIQPPTDARTHNEQTLGEFGEEKAVRLELCLESMFKADQSQTNIVDKGKC